MFHSANLDTSGNWSSVEISDSLRLMRGCKDSGDAGTAGTLRLWLNQLSAEGDPLEKLIRD